MKYSSAPSFRQALESHLGAASRAGGPSLVRLRARLPRPPADWRVPYGRMARDIGLDADLDAGHETAARLLDPVFTGDVMSATWDPSTRNWLS